MVTALFLGLFVLPSYATWSIVIVDPKTKEIGIAGASCTYSVYGIGAIAPGKGAIVVQAMSSNKARAKGLEMIRADVAPGEILKMIRDSKYDPEEQQYAIVTIKQFKTPVTYTGSLTTAYRGALTTAGISVQGNTLTDSAELRAVLNVAIEARKKGLPMQDVLMLALEAGAKLGGDKRCGERKASSAFLTVARPDDDPEHPFLNLIVNATDETLNAVQTLRQKFDKQKTGVNK